ncbi:uncharacterized protein LOC115632131 isoform X1 [Scaptodrosophila lebanonensis]|uniref:Uncharacterized protein LOC115632131 isoform X1 n=1 Tax=Drosophila lebanonensis TaxID=7225 RepID=A0A6J2U9H5_DROLE|nr:uncharacterized protein LOC115632131 isoform X1 [Scaptodrosophila lebanonensis]
MVKKTNKPKKENEGIHLISEADWLAREQSYLQRLRDLKTCLSFIDEATKDYESLELEQIREKHWNHYVRCDGLPHPQYPPDIRRFIEEIRHFENINRHDVVDWTLSINERSILTQDIFCKDLTRRTQIKSSPNIGAIYEMWVQRILSTLNQMNIMLDNELEMSSIELARALEIVAMRAELQREIEILLDKLTYRVICSDDAYMVSKDGIVANYCYKSDSYNFHIWCLRDVPLRFKQMEPPLMFADLICTGVTVQLPLSILTDKLTLQCVHAFYDHYTEYCKSYEQVIDISTDNLNAGIANIEDCLINEWLMQVEIQTEMFDKLERKLKQYEENMLAQAAKESQSKSKRDEAKNKPIKEAPVVPPGMFPDPYNAFLDREQKQYIEFLDEIYHPHKLNLEREEINLRRYIMLGGVFSLIFVCKPKHTDFQKFNITLHDDGRILISLRDVVADLGRDEQVMGPLLGEAPSQLSGAQMEQALRSRLQMVQLSEHIEGGWRLGPDEVPYFFVTFKLPRHLCLWGVPMPCHFMEEPSERVVEEEPTTENEPLPSKKKKQKKRLPDTSPHSPRVSSISANIDTSLAPERISRPNPSYINRRAVQSQNIYRSTILATLRRTILRPSILPSVTIKNFPLTGKLLTTAHIRNLQRHLLPRILPSFKFPHEFKDDLEELLLVKQKKNRLKRRTEVDHELDLNQNVEFNFVDQYGPESIYPVFDRREKVMYFRSSMEHESSSEDDGQPTQTDKNMDEPTLFSMLNTFNEMQERYENKHQQITAQPNFVVKHKTPKQVQTSEPASSSAREYSSIRGRSGSRKRSRSFIHTSSTDLTKRDPNSSPLATQPSVEMSLRVPEVDSFHDEISQPTSRKSRMSTSSRRPSQKVGPIVKHWTTKYIRETEFDKEKLTITIKTDRLGLFGFAYKRYEHFPFRDWCVQPPIEEGSNEILFTLDTFHVRVVMYISNKGIRGYVTDLVKEFVAKPVKYLTIEEPIADFLEIKKRFRERNVNIFAEHDAGYYIENGYFSQKHLAAELHVYDAIAVHCKLMKFLRSSWNRLATRRNIVLCLRNPKDMTENAQVTTRVTPDNSTFVEISELCSDDLDVFKLEYKPTWRNIGMYSDLHHLINSMYPHATDVRNRDPRLMYYIRKLLTEIKPLSFS